MKNKKISLCLMVLSLGIFQIQNSQAFELGVLGGLHYSTLTVDPAVTGDSYSSPSAPAFGVFIETSMVPLIGFELGAFYVPRKYSVHSLTGNSDVTYGLTQFQIPALVRLHLIPFLSFGVGGYYAHSLGDIQADSTVGGVTTSRSITYDSVNYSQNEFGLLGSVRFEVPILPLLNIMADARYLRDLKNINTASNSITLKLHGVQVLVGASFGF